MSFMVDSNLLIFGLIIFSCLISILLIVACLIIILHYKFIMCWLFAAFSNHKSFLMVFKKNRGIDYAVPVKMCNVLKSREYGSYLENPERSYFLPFGVIMYLVLEGKALPIDAKIVSELTVLKNWDQVLEFMIQNVEQMLEDQRTVIADKEEDE